MQHVFDAVIVASGDAQANRDPFDRFEIAVKAFLARYRVENTRHSYGTALQQWGEWSRENRVDPLAPHRSHIELFARELEATGRMPSTVASKLNALGSAFKMWMIDGMVEKDPMLTVKRPQLERRSTSTLFSTGEVVDMLAVAEKSSPQDYALIALLAHHGLRIGAICGIDIERVQASKGSVSVDVYIKGGRRQVIVLNPLTAFVVHRLLQDRGEAGPLFTTRTGRRMDRKAAGLVVKRIATAAGVTKRAHPHAFRKSMVTIARNNGVPDREIHAAAGWSPGSNMLPFYDGGKETLQANAGNHLALIYDRSA